MLFIKVKGLFFSSQNKEALSVDGQDIPVNFEVDLMYLIFKCFQFRGLYVECKNLPHLVSLAENGLFCSIHPTKH